MRHTAVKNLASQIIEVQAPLRVNRSFIDGTIPQSKARKKSRSGDLRNAIVKLFLDKYGPKMKTRPSWVVIL
jgi:hypothetical protein